MGLGSNIGNSRLTLRNAVRDLNAVLQEIQVSSVYVTAPQGYSEQSDFLNIVVIGFFRGTPRELLVAIQNIETRYGRNRIDSIKNGPRTLDIDILLFGELAIHESDLVIPHERMNERQFVLIPLLELEEEQKDPSGKLYREILSLLPDQDVRKAGNLYG